MYATMRPSAYLPRVVNAHSKLLTLQARLQDETKS